MTFYTSLAYADDDTAPVRNHNYTLFQVKRMTYCLVGVSSDYISTPHKDYINDAEKEIVSHIRTFLRVAKMPEKVKVLVGDVHIFSSEAISVQRLLFASPVDDLRRLVVEAISWAEGASELRYEVEDEVMDARPVGCQLNDYRWAHAHMQKVLAAR